MRGLVELYDHLNQQGLTYLQTAKTELNRLQNKANVSARHVPLQIFAANLANLERWRSHRERLFDALTQYQFAPALEYLKRVSAEEKYTFAWLDSVVSPSWEAWETFCLDIQRSLAFWQGYNHREAWAQLAYLAKKIPADLPPVQAQILQAQFEEMVKDLVNIETNLEQSLTLLQQAAEAQVYEQVTGYLEQARELEHKYFAAGQSPLTIIINRYAQFKDEARRGNDHRLTDLIAQASRANDPLGPGYEKVSAIIEQGKKAEASRDEVQAAWKLAPDSEELAKKIEQFETDEIVGRVLKDIRGGRLEEAGRLLEAFKPGRARSLPFQCLLDIYSGYQHLYGYPEPFQALQERINAARQAVNMAKSCQGVELSRERDTLKALILAYSSFQARKWRNLDLVQEQLAAEQDGASHAFVSRLREEIKGVSAWRERRERILEAWGEQQYIQARVEFENVTTPEEKALAWLADESQANWQTWRDFGEVAGHGFEDWQKHDYENAQKWLGLAAARIPTDLKQNLKTSLETYFKETVADLQVAQAGLNQAQQLLNMNDAAYYDQVTDELKKAQQIEEKYEQQNEVKGAYVRDIAARYDQFKQAALVGDVKLLGVVLQASVSEGDPLSRACERIRNIINTAKQPKATPKQILEALKLAPQDSQLLKQYVLLERQRKLLPRILTMVVAGVVGLVILCGLSYVVYLRVASGSLALVPNLILSAPSPAGPTATPLSGNLPKIIISITATPSMTPIPQPTPPPTVSPTPALTKTPDPTATPTLSPASTPAFSTGLTAGLARSGLYLDLFDGDLGPWSVPINFERDRPSLYLNKDAQWNIWTAAEPYTFWAPQPVSGPVDFTMSLNVVRPNSRYGLVVKDQGSGETFSFYVRQAEEDQWAFEVRQDSEVITQGPVLTYSQANAPFNNLIIKLTANAIGFSVNDSEVVYIQQLAENYQRRWELGIAADENAHAIIGSARVYTLVPAR